MIKEIKEKLVNAGKWIKKQWKKFLIVLGIGTIAIVASITILNVHSHPQVGDNWTVSFETTGLRDLVITPDDQASIDDLDFISLKCGDEERIPQILEGDVIFYPNWFCIKEGQIVHLVNVARDHYLKFQFGDEIKYAYNSPDTETLRPDAAGDECSIPLEAGDACPDHYLNVNVVNDATYVQTNVPTKRDLYNLPAPSGSGTINFIKIYVRCKETGTGNAKASLKSNSTVTDGTYITLSSSWVTYSQQWNTNPAPPGTDAWTWDDITALQIGVLLDTPGGVNRAWCSQVYVEVDYSAAAERRAILKAQ